MATLHDGAWWFGCYGSPAFLLKTDAKFCILGHFDLDCSLPSGSHRVRVEHRPDGDGAGCRIESPLAWNERRAGLQFQVNSDANPPVPKAKALTNGTGRFYRHIS